MENGAKGVEVIISGKLRAQRAKAMKFRPSDDRRSQGKWVTVFPGSRRRLIKRALPQILLCGEFDQADHIQGL